MSKLWLNTKNPYVLNYVGRIKTYLFRALYHLIMLGTYSLMLIVISIEMLLESFFVLHTIYLATVKEPIEAVDKTLKYMFFKALFYDEVLK